MRTISELTNDVNEIVKEVESGTIDLEKAETLVNGAAMIVDTFKMQLEYHKLREEKAPDDLPSDEQIKNAESTLSRAKKAIEKRKDG